MRLINNQFRSHCVIRQLLLWNKNFGLNLLLSNCIILYRLIRLNNKRDGKLTLRKILFLLRKCGKPLNNLTRHFWHFFSTLLDIKQANGHVHAVISFLLYFIKKNTNAITFHSNTTVCRTSVRITYIILYIHWRINVSKFKLICYCIHEHDV